MDPDERRRASTLLAAKADVADEGVPADVSTAEEQGEREAGGSAAVAGQPQKRVALVHRLPDAPSPPVGIGFHCGDHCIGTGRPAPPLPALRSGDYGVNGDGGVAIESPATT
jgi:hypothetical protein